MGEGKEGTRAGVGQVLFITVDGRAIRETWDTIGQLSGTVISEVKSVGIGSVS